ncbi:VOC family protein [Dysgonomonas sp. 25]|uniref:VOC family protein n=1 Tax=Dysgonomonas sp. 25 TaxID=2302933 RepID=UPI0013D6301E|nr:VOC family protein [Dysgonomonas sp. 25]NDV67430.1 hypothetical protein [Dysgonomonas sp. 25]
MKLKVHLVFPGTCEEASNFYCQTLKGEVGFLFRKEEEKIAGLAEEDKGKIGYIEIKTPHFVIAGEDANHNEKVTAGNNNKLVLSFDDLQECKRVFDAFAENGTITMPFVKTFFTEGIGEVTDKYGIPWIIMMSDDDYEG